MWVGSAIFRSNIKVVVFNISGYKKETIVKVVVKMPVCSFAAYVIVPYNSNFGRQMNVTNTIQILLNWS